MKVLLVCSAGMSSAIAAKSLHEAAEKEGWRTTNSLKGYAKLW